MTTPDSTTSHIVAPTPTVNRRRLLVGAAAAAGAWSMPAITTLDAAAALASCVPGSVDWDAFATGSTFTSTVVNGVAVSMSVSTLPGTTLLPANGTVRAGPNGASAGKALQFQQLPNASGIGQDVTFTFSAAVTNVSFTIFDIDNVRLNGWGDRIVVLTPGFSSTSVGVGRGKVIGKGTSNNPFRSNQKDEDYSDTSNQGNVILGYAGPISSFTFRYTNDDSTGGPNQRISVSDISWGC